MGLFTGIGRRVCNGIQHACLNDPKNIEKRIFKTTVVQALALGAILALVIFAIKAPLPLGTRLGIALPGIWAFSEIATVSDIYKKWLEETEIVPNEHPKLLLDLTEHTAIARALALLCSPPDPSEKLV